MTAARLLDRHAAAAYLGMCLTAFVSRVQPRLPCVRNGRVPLFGVEDLAKWNGRPEVVAARMSGSQQGLVYLLEALGSGFVKIGFTEGKSAHARARSLATACPYPVVLLASVKGSLQDECALHSRFHAHRGPAGNEWFHDHPDIRRHFDVRTT